MANDSSIPIDALVSFTADLVRIPSVLGNEGPVAQRVRQEMRALEFDSIETDEAGSVVGVIRGAADGPTIVLDAHMDTVDIHPREAWTHDPFGGEVVDGRLYGRGSSDMKGALAAIVHGVGALDRSRLTGTVIASASVGEELVEGAALRQVMNRTGADYVVIGEASELNVVRAGRGRAELVVTTKGRPSHASTPDHGVNAVHKMRAVIEQIESLPMPEHVSVGPGVMCLTDIISVPHPAHSVVPSGCRATYERRLLPGETSEQLIDELRAAAARAGADDTDFRLASTDYTSYAGTRWDQPKWFAPWELPEEHELVQGALAALRGIGLEPEQSSYQFCTNGAYSAGEAGVPTIGFGPSTADLAHVVDEYIEIDQLTQAAAGYRAIVAGMLAT